MIPELTIKLHKEYGHIIYYDDVHKYYNTRNNKELISVTTIIGKYKEKFNSKYWTKRKASDYGTTPEIIKQYWDKLAFIGQTRGTIGHKYIEDRWANKVFPIDYGVYVPDMEMIDFINFHNKQKKLLAMCETFLKEHPQYIPIRTELIVANENIAGQIDFFGYDLANEEYILLDWKFDKAMSTSNKYQSYKAPLKHLEDSSINKYSLQISLYRELLKPVIPQINTCYIVWFNIENDSYKKIPIKNLQHEANLLLQSF